MTVKSKVLIVDDDLTILNLLKTLLEIEGFEVLRLDNVNIASFTGLLQNNRPDVILLDVNLRQINGFNLLRVLRQSEELKAIRVIMTSGMDLTSRCKLEGADAFLLKPYMPNELVRLLKSLVAQS